MFIGSLPNERRSRKCDIVLIVRSFCQVTSYKLQEKLSLWNSLPLGPNNFQKIHPNLPWGAYFFLTFCITDVPQGGFGWIFFWKLLGPFRRDFWRETFSCSLFLVGLRFDLEWLDYHFSNPNLHRFWKDLTHLHALKVAPTFTVKTSCDVAHL